MHRETEAVRAIQALRLLRDETVASGELPGDKYEELIRARLAPQTTTNLLWPIELMITLLQARLIQVRFTGEKDMMSPERFERLYQDRGLKSFLFSLVPHFREMQRALGFSSLSDLQQRTNPNSISVTPVFGAPFTTHRHNIFVLMPFSETLLPVYEECIRPVTQGMGLNVSRADDLFSRQTVMQLVWGAIFAADLIIADCTGRNPNVFYELGMAHTIGKSSIIIAQELQDIPFDIRQFRYILYQNSDDGLEALAADLEHAIPQLIARR